MEPEALVLRVGYFVLFITLLLMTWAYSIRADASAFQSKGPSLIKSPQGEVGDDYPSCSFNPLCRCSNPGPTDFGIVTCHGIPFGKLPGKLKTSRVFVLSMIENGLQVLEDRQLIGSGLWRLEIKRNNLDFLANESLAGLEKTLWELDLSENALLLFPTLPLLRLSKLNLLDLSRNKITDIDQDDLQGPYISTLTCFNLSGNRLVHIPGDVFSHLSKLERLDLSDNSLRNLDESESLSGLPDTLTHLYLRNNLFHKIPFGALSNLGSLQVLDLSNNLISSLYDPLYYTTRSIHVDKLLLDYNFVYVLEPYSFQNFASKIGSLSMSYNPLTFIEDDAFQDTSIKELDLSNCYLNQLGSKALHGLQKTLEVLNLSHNNLSLLPTKSFTEFDRLHTLMLDQNPWLDLSEIFEALRYHLQKLSLTSKTNRLQVTIDEFKSMRNLRQLNLSSIGPGINYIAPEILNGFGPALDDIKIVHAGISSLKNQGFQNVPGLKSLDFSNNKIVRIDADAFENVGHSLTKLKLNRGLRMTIVPPQVFSKLTKLQDLDLSSNGLTGLPDQSFAKNENLIYLNLRYNKINSLGPQTLENLSRVTRIYLSFNHLHTIHGNTFYRLKELDLLELNENKITTMHKHAFQDLVNLKRLNLAGNKIRTLEDETFQNLPKLQRLDLSWNELENLNLDAFEQLGTLSTNFEISLRYNKIKRLVVINNGNLTRTPSLKVSDLDTSTDERNGSTASTSNQPFVPSISSSSIEIMDIAHNDLAYIAPYFFTPIGSTLVKLDLSYNALKNLSHYQFVGINFLQIFDVSFNRIETIDYNTFHELEEVQIIDLSFNYLRELPPDLFENCKKLRVFSIRNNQIRSLADSLFSQLPIEILNLNNNHILRFPDALISTISQTLVHLDLSGNEIASLNSNQIESLVNLQWLSLANNRLLVIADKSFDTLQHLVYLDLSGNFLNRINVRWFVELKSTLLHLNLSNLSSIDFIPEFDQFSQLRTLNISRNNLMNLPTNFGVNVSTLIVLDISHNNLQFPPNTIWHTIPRLMEINLASNPIRGLTNDSFLQLDRLYELDVSELPLEFIQSGVFTSLDCLQALVVGPSSKMMDQFGAMIEHIHSLQSLHLKMPDSVLEFQDAHFPKKLSNIALTGLDLTELGAGTLRTIQSRKLELKLENTGVGVISESFFHEMGSASRINIQIIGNNSMLKSISSPSRQDLDSLIIDPKTNFVCSCDASGWIEFWLRSWMDQTCPINSFNPKESLVKCSNFLDTLRHVQCRSSKGLSLLQAFVTELECDWSRGNLVGTSLRLVLSLLVCNWICLSFTLLRET